MSTAARAAAAEHWYRHRTTVENIFRDSKLGTALLHLPSGYPQVSTAWMWGALLAASMAAWLHQLTCQGHGPPWPESAAQPASSTGMAGHQWQAEEHRAEYYPE